MKSALVALDRTVARVEMVGAIFCLALIVLVTGLAVFCRYVLQDPLTWSADVSTVALVWLSFLGAATILREGGHVAATGLVEKLPTAARRAVNLLLLALLLATVALLCRFAVSAALVQAGQTISTLGVPRSLYTLPVVYATGSMALWALSAILGAADPDRPFQPVEGER